MMFGTRLFYELSRADGRVEWSDHTDSGAGSIFLPGNHVGSLLARARL